MADEPTNILNSIDDTISERCACPCNEPIPPDGPSAWFASQACQWRWNQRRASNPAEVYNGPSVAMLQAAEMDAARATPPPIPATTAPARPGASYHDPSPTLALTVEDARYLMWARDELEHLGPAVIQRPDPEPEVRGDHRHLIGQPGWIVARTGPLAWRRHCANCGQAGVPVERAFAVDLDLDLSILGIYDDPANLMPFRYEIRHTCPRCYDPFPGPVMLAQHRADPGRDLGLRLACGDVAIFVRVAWDLASEPELVATAWADLERTLLDRMAWRDLCSVDGCGQRARALFTVNRSVAFAGQSWQPGDIGLCPDHRCELLAAFDERARRPVLGRQWIGRSPR